MQVSMNTLSRPSFKALILEKENADTNQQKIISKLANDRDYFSGDLLQSTHKQNIDIVVSPRKNGFINVCLRQNVRGNYFIPTDNSGKYMIERFDSDDAFVLKNIKEFAGNCTNFMTKRMYDNPKNRDRLDKFTNAKRYC